MGYLDGLPKDECPLCHRAFRDWVNTQAYAGKWVDIDLPTDVFIFDAVQEKNWLYKVLKKRNKEIIEQGGRAVFNLDSLR
ncbi:MAG: hypothetical protein ACFFCW_00225 [Candidatus Hodarchaeota archaeon]